ncbi:hypothetical protein EDC04DRAFT_370326 [Pisolithus marmoratus]|nr:hypothetical protein EDC04DRAFT_370326 [Pisolithus marmoratus]
MICLLRSTSRIFHERTALKRHDDKVLSVTLPPDGRCIESGFSNNANFLWNMQPRALVGSPLTGHAGARSVGKMLFLLDRFVLIFGCCLVLLVLTVGAYVTK